MSCGEPAVPDARVGFWGTGPGLDRLADYFARRGFQVARIDGADLTMRWPDDRVELVVLDVTCVDERVLEVCRQGAAAGHPAVVVVIPERGDGEDVIAALDAGAQDVLACPYHPREALARVRAVLRSPRTTVAPRLAWEFGDWTLDAERRALLKHGRDGVVLPPGEFELLRGFVARPLCVLSREELESLSPAAEDGLDARVLDVRISRLRARFGVHGGGQIIETVRGEGYRLALPVQPLH
jgi:two-component system OmpR family response regulator